MGAAVEEAAGPARGPQPMSAACKVIDLAAFQRRETDTSTGGGDPPHEFLLRFLAAAWAYTEASSADARANLATFHEIVSGVLNDTERARLESLLTWARDCAARFLAGDADSAPERDTSQAREW